MISLSVIGIGTGNPDHLTLEARREIAWADLILIPLKGAEKAELAELRRRIIADAVAEPRPHIAEFLLPVRDPAISPYKTRVARWHDAIADAWEAEITENLGSGSRVALLVWGDPSLYDSTLRIAERLAKRMDLTTRVIPGITAIQALCAAHAIPLNSVGEPVVITTGRQLRDTGWPNGADTVVVMLDQGCAFDALDPAGIQIWWGAYVGMAEQIILSGPLEACADTIRTTRAKARADHGWIMDIYLMRKV